MAICNFFATFVVYLHTNHDFHYEEILSPTININPERSRCVRTAVASGSGFAARNAL